MNIVVCVKQTIDTEAVITLDQEGRVITEGQTLVIDPYSEFAVERAVQLKEEKGAEVILLSVGGQEVLPALRHGLSMGADRAYLIDDPALKSELDPSAKAKILSAALAKLEPNLIMGGYKSADTLHAQTLPRIATLRGLAHVNVVTHLEVSDDSALATREIDDGVEVIEVPLPAVICAQQGLAEPRYPNVRDIMQSKKKPITTWTLADVGLEGAIDELTTALLSTLRFREKPARSGGRIIEGEVAEAVRETTELLASEAGVL